MHLMLTLLGTMKLHHIPTPVQLHVLLACMHTLVSTKAGLHKPCETPPQYIKLPKPADSEANKNTPSDNDVQEILVSLQCTVYISTELVSVSIIFNPYCFSYFL